MSRQRHTQQSTCSNTKMSGQSDATAEKCAFKGCKTALGVHRFPCKECSSSYCTTHRSPEAHGFDSCAVRIAEAARRKNRADGDVAAALRAKGQGSKLNKAGAVDKEREDARKRLREKIANARKPAKEGGDEDASKGSKGSKGGRQAKPKANTKPKAKPTSA